uniref:Uncharacterized protein n=1 Tax=Avena sativa TaxID=4498 RepID=A0ACD6AQS1_AVESA
MMMVVGSHKAVNRMSNSALAACMAPLLLRPLLLGECEIDNDFSMAGDGSFQLLQAAAAANHAQAIIIIMLEEYDQIFDDLEEGSCSSDAYTESDDGDVDKEDSTDNDNHDEDGSYDSGEDDIEEDLDDNSSGGSECDGNSRLDAKRNKVGQPPAKAAKTESNASTDNIAKPRSSSSRAKLMKSGSANRSKRTLWGRTSARKDLSTEEGECCSDDEALIEKLENNKADLQSKVSKEVKENANLKASLEKRKGSLHERRIALEKEVENLRDQLQKERGLRTSLESGLMNMRRGQVSLPSSIDRKTKADLEEVAAAEADILNLKQKACDLRGLLSSQVYSLLCEPCKRLVEEKQNAGVSSESSTASRLVPGTGSMAELVEQLRKQAAQHTSPSTGAQRLARQNSNSLNRFQGLNAFSSTRTEVNYALLEFTSAATASLWTEFKYFLRPILIDSNLSKFE